jgi:hypothetical protein
MENLRSLMQSLDSISELIPEGTYLDMANNLKKVHAQIPDENDFPVTDYRNLQIDVPFMPTVPDTETDEDGAQDPYDIFDDDEHYDERYYPLSSAIPNLTERFRNPDQGFFVSFDRNRDGTGCIISTPVERCLIRQDLILISKYGKECLKKLRELKPVKNVTGRIKWDAIKSYVNTRGLTIPMYTFDCMYRTYPQLFAYDMRTRMFTREGQLTRFGKEVERDLYMEYIEVHNSLVQLKSLDAHTEMNWLIQAEQISKDRLAELNGR